jgi:Flp pilus assembly protein TadG
MKRNREHGQALVEFSLVIVFFIVLLIVISDVAPLISNFDVAKQVSASGARAGSIYYPDGSFRTCYQDVVNAVGEPVLIKADWTLEVSGNCSNIPTDTMESGEQVTVSIVVNYTPPFIGGFGWPPKASADAVWTFTVTTVETAR